MEPSHIICIIGVLGATALAPSGETPKATLVVSDLYSQTFWGVSGQRLRYSARDGAYVEDRHAKPAKLPVIRRFAFQLRFSMPKGAEQPSIIFREGAGHVIESTPFEAGTGRWVAGYNQHRPTKRTELRLNVGIATGAWRTLGTYSATRWGLTHSSGEKIGRVTIEKTDWSPTWTANHVVVTAELPVPDPTCAYRAVVIGLNGKEFPSLGVGARRVPIGSVDFGFEGKLLDVDRIEFQSRPYQWLRFPHVRLSPKS